MSDSIRFGADGHTNHLFDLMRGEVRRGRLQDNVSFLPGFSLKADPALRLSGEWRSPNGWILEIDARMDAPGGWFGLHVSLPAQDLRRFGLVGFAARIAGAEMHLARACVRSGTASGFVDCFFDKHLLFRPEETTFVDVLPTRNLDDLPLEAPWRELVLFLPTRSFRASILDMRVFVI